MKWKGFPCSLQIVQVSKIFQVDRDNTVSITAGLDEILIFSNNSV